MSAPEFQTRDQVRTAPDNTVKFKEGWKMKVAAKASKIKMVISRGLATQHPVKLVAALTLGAGLLAMTALQFAPDRAEEPTSEFVGSEVFISGEYDDNLVRKGNRWEVQRQLEESFPIDESSVESVRDQAVIIGEYDDNLVLKGGRWEVQRQPEESSTVDQGSAEDPSYQRRQSDEYRFMDLEDEPLSVEFLRTYVYPEEEPSSSQALPDYQQEIERLQGEINALLAQAREDPSTDSLELDRDLRNLHYRIDMLRLAAMEQP
jgi:hypothetical protein